MRIKESRCSLLVLVAVACVIMSGTALADNCTGHSFTYTFDHIQGGIFGGILESTQSSPNYDCVNFTISNRTLSQESTLALGPLSDFTVELITGKPSSPFLEYSITLNNTAGFLNVCIEANNQAQFALSASCTPAATVFKVHTGGLPATLATNTTSGVGPILDSVALDYWGANISTAINIGVAAQFQVDLVKSPEPGSMLLLGSGLLTAAGIIRRKLLRT